MNRFEEIQKLVSKYLKDNCYLFDLETSENDLYYTISKGSMDLLIQIECFDEKQELLYPNEYCMMQNSVYESGRYCDNDFSFTNSEIKTIDDIIPEIEECLSFYKERLVLYKNVTKKLNEIKELFEEYDLDYNDEIDMFKLIY